jgi:hypothetical protein
LAGDRVGAAGLLADASIASGEAAGQAAAEHAMRRRGANQRDGRAVNAADEVFATERPAAARPRLPLLASYADAEDVVQDRGATSEGSATTQSARRFSVPASVISIDRTLELLDADVVLVSDGGPDQHAARHPVVGADRVARLAVNLSSSMR